MERLEFGSVDSTDPVILYTLGPFQLNVNNSSL